MKSLFAPTAKSAEKDETEEREGTCSPDICKQTKNK